MATNKAAAGISRVLLGITVIALLGIAIVGVIAGERRLAHHTVGTVELLGVIVVAAFIVAGVVNRIARRIPKRTVVELDLAKFPAEAADTSPLAVISAKKPTLREIVDALARAAADKRVAGVFVHATFSEAGMAGIQEIRDALTRLRGAGKFAIAYSDSYSNGSYYLATACDEILLQPGGEVGLSGLALLPNFYKAMLDKAGIDIEAEGRWEYKSAADQITRSRFSRPSKENLEQILNSQFDQLVDGVVRRSGNTEREIRRLIDRGPFVAPEAEKEGLVDALAYRDQAIDRAKARAGDGASLLDVNAYGRRNKRQPGKGRPTTIAVITATGGIVSRAQGFDPIAGPNPMAADKISEAIRKAVDDKRVKAVLLRVNSPGGSSVASETIWRETVRAREKKKPVVVSMGNVAASGGYYIAAAADRIVAHPGTITGSIGVISGKPIVGRAKRKLGVHPEELKTSANAAMFSPNRPFNDSETERFRAGLDAVYADFTGRVVDGRGLTPAQVDKIARGRVWTGVDAHEVGLVDELGGFATAIDITKKLAGGKPDAPVKVLTFPKKAGPLARIRPPKRDSSDDIAALSSLAAIATALAGPLRRVAGELGLGDRGALWCGLNEDDWLIR
jgi:protease-4